MIFLCIARQPDRIYRAYVIEAQGSVSAFDCKSYAARIIGVDDLCCFPTGEEARPDCALRHVGSDAGTRPNRHLEIQPITWKGGKATRGDWGTVR